MENQSAYVPGVLVGLLIGAAIFLGIVRLLAW